MSQSSTSSKIDRLFQDFNGKNSPGASVAVFQNGKIVFGKGYGLEHLETQKPCTLDTNFRLASVTKQFTAMSILLLAERDKLSLDDRIVKFFPELAAHGKDITVRCLLTHTSGLLNYEDLIPSGTKIPLRDQNVLHLLLQQSTTYFAPGTEFRYSNSGYALLALIVEKASGNTFSRFLQQNIFTPLGMTNSVAYEEGLSSLPHRAFGYTRVKPNSFQPSDQSVTSAVLGDGGIYSSINDLFKWDQALYSEKLISRRSLEKAFAVSSQTSDLPGAGYGFGWYIDRNRGTQHVWHPGSTCGFSTWLERFPEKKLTVIILSNQRDVPLAAIAKKITDLYY